MKNFKLFIIAAIVTLAIVVSINIDKVEENLSWVFEADESQAALPELSNREIEEASNKNKAKPVVNVANPAPKREVPAPNKESAEAKSALE